MELLAGGIVALIVGFILGMVTQRLHTSGLLAAANAERDREHASAAAAQTRVAELGDVQQARERAEATLASTQAMLAGAQATGEGQAAAIERLNDELHAIKSDLATARDATTKDRAELARLAAVIAAQSNTLGDREAQIKRLRGDSEHAGNDLAASRNATATLKASLAEQEAKTAAHLATVQERDKRLAAATDELREVRGKLQSAQAEARGLAEQLAERDARAESDARAAAEKLALLASARTELGNQFKALAADVLKAQSQQFGADSGKAIGHLLEPVKTKLAEFQQKVEHFQSQHQTTAAELRAELKHLGDASVRLSTEANELTQALTTQSQVRGAWGEQVLQRVLEVAGLHEGQDFAVQEVHKLPDGSLPRPDVVVNLPGERRIVVDSKLSLVDYLAYTSATAEDARSAALKRHVSAVRQHVRELSAKDYAALLGQHTLDFVIAFVPIEQAYLAAVEADGTLYEDAWQRRIMFACPSTLLYALRMVSYLWTQEAQQRNVTAIVERGAALYDKFVNFTKDLQNVGSAIDSAKTAYDGALKKLATGSGNLVRQVEMLRKLGVKPAKQIAADLTERAEAPELAAPAVAALPTTPPSGTSGNAAPATPTPVTK